MIRQFRNRRVGHEQEGFLEDYSADDFESLYAGLFLAAQFGGNNSEGWPSRFLQEFSQCTQAEDPGSQAGVAPGSTRSSITWSENGGWHL